jgi:deazaflavin-dependent oxidoreductase (nitroreductase family)
LLKVGRDRRETRAVSDYNRAIIDEFRANRGRVGGDWEGTPLLLLHHTGARSHAERITPLGYLADDERYVLVASNGGARSNPHWYHNLNAHPDVLIEVGAETIAVASREAAGEERERLFAALVERYPHLRDYEEKSGRVVPVIVLEPSSPR